ncbi:MAG TPA: hypothetical protein VG897_00545, partial [Terriglobales bacterium]|nr:hypothetical protein [Terriglobales bacterium]
MRTFLALITLTFTLTAVAQQPPTANTATVDPDGTTRVTRVVPVPGTLSPEAKKYLSRPYSDHEPAITPEENRAHANAWQDQLAKDMQSMYPTTVEKNTIAGIPVRIITPKTVPAEKKDRILINVHGGGFQADWG